MPHLPIPDESCCWAASLYFSRSLMTWQNNKSFEPPCHTKHHLEYWLTIPTSSQQSPAVKHLNTSWTPFSFFVLLAMSATVAGGQLMPAVSSLLLLPTTLWTDGSEQIHFVLTHDFLYLTCIKNQSTWTKSQNTLVAQVENRSKLYFSKESQKK